MLLGADEQGKLAADKSSNVINFSDYGFAGWPSHCQNSPVLHRGPWRLPEGLLPANLAG